MSRSGNCLDNAPMESFFQTLKVERLHNRIYSTRAEAKARPVRLFRGLLERFRI